MAEPLTHKQLLERILRAVDESGWQALILDPHKPFKLRLFRGEENGIDVRIYIWNCTHGGGDARAADEYRVQITGTVPSVTDGDATLLLGWHSGYEVFVGFDIKNHAGRASQSPSIQVKEDALLNAHNRAFAIYRRQNGEIAVAFRPEFLVEYALSAGSLHLTGEAFADTSLLNNLGTLEELQIDKVKNQKRRVMLLQIARKYREADFRKRVLGAYEHQCAFCGVQLELIDAAHIIPVAAPTSTDETNNGVALCKLHHSAFDRKLISFNERYKIEVSDSEIARLTAANLVGGLSEFKGQLRSAIILPNDRRDFPTLENITAARKVRGWG